MEHNLEKGHRTLNLLAYLHDRIDFEPSLSGL